MRRCWIRFPVSALQDKDLRPPENRRRPSCRDLRETGIGCVGFTFLSGTRGFFTRKFSDLKASGLLRDQPGNGIEIALYSSPMNGHETAYRSPEANDEASPRPLASRESYAPSATLLLQLPTPLRIVTALRARGLIDFDARAKSGSSAEPFGALAPRILEI